MSKIFNLSWMNVRNIICSKVFFGGLILTYMYSLMWILAFEKYIPNYTVRGYNFEFFRMLYVGLIYLSFILLGNDIENNTDKVIFSGILTRTEILLSKLISIIEFGIIVFFTIELNGLMASLILKDKLGLEKFIHYNHLILFINVMTITVFIGTLVMLILSIRYRIKIISVVTAILLGIINFYSAFFITMEIRLIEAGQDIPRWLEMYVANPLAKVCKLGCWDSIEGVISVSICSIILFIISIFIMNRREIK